jgi:hypothetical protein
MKKILEIHLNRFNMGNFSSLFVIRDLLGYPKTPAGNVKTLEWVINQPPPKKIFIRTLYSCIMNWRMDFVMWLIKKFEFEFKMLGYIK